MRVVGGEHASRRFAAPHGRDTRPTSERVREALFAILGDVAGMRVLDLFAGSGALGIEALSRGAGHATFVERSAAAVVVIKRNLARLGLEQRSSVARADVRSGGWPGERHDLVFIDPPYAEAAELGPILSSTLPRRLSPRARVVAESDRRSPLELALPLRLERRYGDTLIRIYELATT